MEKRPFSIVKISEQHQQVTTYNRKDFRKKLTVYKSSFLFISRSNSFFLVFSSFFD